MKAFQWLMVLALAVTSELAGPRELAERTADLGEKSPVGSGGAAISSEVPGQDNVAKATQDADKHASPPSTSSQTDRSARLAARAIAKRIAQYFRMAPEYQAKLVVPVAISFKGAQGAPAGVQFMIDKTLVRIERMDLQFQGSLSLRSPDASGEDDDWTLVKPGAAVVSVKSGAFVVSGVIDIGKSSDGRVWFEDGGCKFTKSLDKPIFHEGTIVRIGNRGYVWSGQKWSVR